LPIPLHRTDQRLRTDHITAAVIKCTVVTYGFSEYTHLCIVLVNVSVQRLDDLVKHRVLQAQTIKHSTETCPQAEHTLVADAHM
jgi:hypothetical protein